jgi:asparagine synthase (glutamine-hydrolysing)
MKGFAADCLLAERSAVGRFFDRAYIRELLAQHESGMRNHLRHLYLLISFELWHRRFIGA